MASVKFILLNLDSGFLIAKFSTIKNDIISNLTQASRSNDYLSQTFFFFFDIKENLKGHLAPKILKLNYCKHKITINTEVRNQQPNYQASTAVIKFLYSFDIIWVYIWLNKHWDLTNIWFRLGCRCHYARFDKNLLLNSSHIILQFFIVWHTLLFTLNFNCF